MNTPRIRIDDGFDSNYHYTVGDRVLVSPNIITYKHIIRTFKKEGLLEALKLLWSAKIRRRKQLFVCVYLNKEWSFIDALETKNIK